MYISAEGQFRLYHQSIIIIKIDTGGSFWQNSVQIFVQTHRQYGVIRNITRLF